MCGNDVGSGRGRKRIGWAGDEGRRRGMRLGGTLKVIEGRPDSVMTIEEVVDEVLDGEMLGVGGVGPWPELRSK